MKRDHEVAPDPNAPSLKKIKVIDTKESASIETLEHFFEKNNSNLMNSIDTPRDIKISKLACYAMINCLKKMQEKHKLVVSYIGRPGIIHPSHQRLLPPASMFRDNKYVSRLHFVLIQGPQNEKVIFDLGSLDGTQITYLTTPKESALTQCIDSMNFLLDLVHKDLSNDDSILPAFCKQFSELKADILTCITSTKTPRPCPEENKGITLKTNEKKIEWLPLPSGIKCLVGLADTLFEIDDSDNLTEDNSQEHQHDLKNGP